MELVLGTVQLGTDYGINNQSGQPSTEESFSILDTAYCNGIRNLDTARDYGESERIIGRYHRKANRLFSVSTKIRAKNGLDEVFQLICDSRDLLFVPSLDILYLHDFDEIKKAGIIELLLECKTRGHCRRIGVSIYSPDDLRHILQYEHAGIDVVQLPMSILDRRWHESGLIPEASASNISLYVRSIFLQGLIFKSYKDPFCIKMGISEQLKALACMSEAKKTSIAKIALDYILYDTFIYGMLLGCETEPQLSEMLQLASLPNCLAKDDIDYIHKVIAIADPMVLEPRNWK